MEMFIHDSCMLHVHCACVKLRRIDDDPVVRSLSLDGWISFRRAKEDARVPQKTDLWMIHTVAPLSALAFMTLLPFLLNYLKN